MATDMSEGPETAVGVLGRPRAPCGVTPPPQLAEDKSLSGLHNITPGAGSHVERCCWAAGPRTGLPSCSGRSGVEHG